MFRNYFKTAWRNLIKNKVYSSINILGLAIGMSVAMLIGCWIWDEISFDHYHQNHKSIAQVMDTKTFNAITTTSEDVAVPLADELRENHSADFKSIALVFHSYTHMLAVGSKRIQASGQWTQPQLPQMLSLKMLYGTRNALDDPSSVLITQSLAKTLFGNSNPINKIIRLDNMTEVKVGGVFEDLPANTTFADTKIFLSWEKAESTLGWLKGFQSDWGTNDWKLYVQLNDNADINKLTDKIRNITRQHLREGKEELMLLPMDKWHLYSEFENGKVSGGRIRYIWMFGIIGILVLLLACINFMNLSTARSSKRAKEVGIRKVVGSVRNQLIWQFLSEALLTALLASVLAVIITQLSLPIFNNLTGKQIVIPYGNFYFLLSTLGFALFTGITSGSYPAFYLSSFKPISVLKGSFNVGKKAVLPRRFLVVLQFTVSIVLIIATIVVYKQIEFAKARSLGYSSNRLITVQMNTPELYGASYNSLRSDLLQTGVIDDMAQSDISPTTAPFLVTDFNWKGKVPESVQRLGISMVTHDFGKTIGWQIKQGRDFSRDFKTDSNSVIINAAAEKLIGFKNSIGQIITWNGEQHKITGVVKDIVMESPYKPIEPCIFLLNYNHVNIITIRLKAAAFISVALTKIQNIFKKYDPNSAFAYTFVSDEYAKKFDDEIRVEKLSAFFTALAIFISCLGLFGMSGFMAEQRTKEIGVRKILGASVFNLWQLLSKEFIWLVLISLLISMPIAYYFMHNWLQNYTYRTQLSWWVFAVAGLGALTITLLTVSFQAIKAAVANPVKSLRTE